MGFADLFLRYPKQIIIIYYYSKPDRFMALKIGLRETGCCKNWSTETTEQRCLHTFEREIPVQRPTDPCHVHGNKKTHNIFNDNSPELHAAYVAREQLVGRQASPVVLFAVLEIG